MGTFGWSTKKSELFSGWPSEPNTARRVLRHKYRLSNPYILYISRNYEFCSSVLLGTAAFTRFGVDDAFSAPW